MINRNTYSRQFVCKCPNNGQPIIYHLSIITAGKMIHVEHINTAIALLDAAFHEQIADHLHKQFGGQQTLSAIHDGVHITTQRGEV